jgi:hypothetical protein
VNGAISAKGDEVRGGVGGSKLIAPRQSEVNSWRASDDRKVRVAAKARYVWSRKRTRQRAQQVRVKLRACLRFDENKKVTSTPCWTSCFDSSLSTEMLRFPGIDSINAYWDTRVIRVCN